MSDTPATETKSLKTVSKSRVRKTKLGKSVSSTTKTQLSNPSHEGTVVHVTQPQGLLFEAETWLALSFVIFLVAVFKPIKRAILGLLDGHAAKVKKELDEARQLREEAERLLADVQHRQKLAFEEATAIVARAQQEAQHVRTTAAQEAETQIKRRQQQALEKISLAEAAAVQDVRNAVIDLALNASRHILAEKMAAGADVQLFDKSIKQLERRLGKANS